MWIKRLLFILLPLQAQATLITETQHLTLLRITKAQPVEPLITAA